MAFRQPKSHRNRTGPAWDRWLAAHAGRLKDVGLPPGLTLSESHWVDFLRNGELDGHPDAYDGFWFGHLSPGQMAALLDLLRASPYAAEPMVGWLHHRLGRRDDVG